MAKHHPDLIMCRKQPGVGALHLNWEERNEGGRIGKRQRRKTKDNRYRHRTNVHREEKIEMERESH